MTDLEIMKAAARKTDTVFGYLWLNHDALASEYIHGTDWDAVAKAAVKMRLKDGRGNDPSAATMRKTFWKVRRLKGTIRRR